MTNPTHPKRFAVVATVTNKGTVHHALGAMTLPTAVFMTENSAKLTYSEAQSPEQITEQLLPFANKFGTDFSVIPILWENETGDPYEVYQTELNAAQLRQQDAVDNMVFGMLNAARNQRGEFELEWDIDIIAAARDVLIETLAASGLINAREFYPYLKD